MRMGKEILTSLRDLALGMLIGASLFAAGFALGASSPISTKADPADVDISRLAQQLG